MQIHRFVTCSMVHDFKYYIKYFYSLNEALGYIDQINTVVDFDLSFMNITFYEIILFLPIGYSIVTTLEIRRKPPTFWFI